MAFLELANDFNYFHLVLFSLLCLPLLIFLKSISSSSSTSYSKILSIKILSSSSVKVL